MILCVAKKGKCTVCGRLMLSGQQRCLVSPPVVRTRTVVLDCPHFLGTATRTVKVYGLGCASSAQEGCDHTVVECELNGYCVMTKNGELRDPEVKRCVW